MTSTLERTAPPADVPDGSAVGSNDEDAAVEQPPSTVAKVATALIVGTFTANRPLKLVLVTLGSMAYQGAPIGWVANHRGHHVLADTVADPHSPQHHGSRPLGRVRACGTHTSDGCSPIAAATIASPPTCAPIRTSFG
ncbi:MAG: hypothetical protein H0U01_02040 [Acidimicrobiia bacterium]|nr:hypothetical protein [Acidimicrobiia bacterium]